MKKLFTIVLALVLTFALAACGCQANTKVEPTTKATTAPTTVATTAPTTEPATAMPSTDVTLPIIEDPTMDTNIPDPSVDTSMPDMTEGTEGTGSRSRMSR